MPRNSLKNSFVAICHSKLTYIKRLQEIKNYWNHVSPIFPLLVLSITPNILPRLRSEKSQEQCRTDLNETQLNNLSFVWMIPWPDCATMHIPAWLCNKYISSQKPEIQPKQQQPCLILLAPLSELLYWQRRNSKFCSSQRNRKKKRTSLRSWRLSGQQITDHHTTAWTLGKQEGGNNTGKGTEIREVGGDKLPSLRTGTSQASHRLAQWQQQNRLRGILLERLSEQMLSYLLIDGKTDSFNWSQTSKDQLCDNWLTTVPKL